MSVRRGCRDGREGHAWYVGSGRLLSHVHLTPTGSGWRRWLVGAAHPLASGTCDVRLTSVCGCE